jgi:hypothetical protein
MRVEILAHGSGADQIIRFAEDEGANLLVTGACGNNRFSEWVQVHQKPLSGHSAPLSGMKVGGAEAEFVRISAFWSQSRHSGERARREALFSSLRRPSLRGNAAASGRERRWSRADDN